MATDERVNTQLDARAPLPLALVFAALFVAYQLPEGLGQRVLHSASVQGVLMVMFLPVAWLCGRALGFRGFDAWYMGLSRGWLALLAAGFALSLAAKAASLGVGAGLGIYRVTAGADAGGWQLLATALWMLPYTFIPSVAEDIVTRGFVMRAFPRLSARWLFIPASAALYVANHIYRLGDGPAEWLMLFCFGLAYAAALYYSRSLWPAIGLHWGWNFAGAFADRVTSVDVLAPAQGPLVSAAAHLAMLGVVVLAARLMRRGPRAVLQN